VPGTPYSQHQLREILDRAIRESNLPLAWSAAGGLREVELHRALALTLLLAREGDPRYEDCARKFVARFALEARPTLGQVKRVADALDQVGHLQDLPAMREGADRALVDLARQLRYRS
jgi:hypothetical protein